MKRLLLLAFALCLAVQTSTAQKQIGYDDLRDFSARSIGGLRPMKDGLHYTTQGNGVIVKYRYADGVAVDTIFNAAKTDPKLAIQGYAFNDDETMMLFPTEREQIYRHSGRANYYVYDVVKRSLTPLSAAGKQQEATLSPDGRKVAFVRSNNLFVKDLLSGIEKQITSDGVHGQIINGIPDWVYEEEYSFSRGFEWAPTSDAVAFYRFDEGNVKYYTMDTFKGGLYPESYDFKYPKAGETNSVVQIKVYSLNSGKVNTIDVGPVTDQYIPRISWTGRKDELAIHRLNRLQNKYEMLFADAQSGMSRVVYSEESPRYIERIGYDKVTFLPDGKRFIIKNENDGWMHLYLYDMNGKLLNQITSGNWEVTSLDAIDANNNKLYFTSTEGSPLRRNLFSINLNGRNKKQMTTGQGTYRAIFSTGAKYYISYFSNTTTPTVVTLHRNDGTLVRTLEDNAKLREKIKEYAMPTKEFFTFKIPEGVELNGYMIKPADFDPNKKYPVFMTQYSGPGSQSVSDSWGLSWESALLKEGYLIVCIDGRGTGARGEEFRKCTYRDMGRLEVMDQISGAKYLASLPYVDGKRIGIYGWSYGGFMALNCILQGADVFAAAIAVAPVTSWRYYDSIYTEVYNGLPADNAAGYDNNSPITHASKLKGKLLLAHGTGDDNVHIQNSYEMINKLVAAGKDFEMLIYPDQNHGMGSGRNHLMRRCIEFTKANL